jgi:uncharacterized protein YkwD
MQKTLLITLFIILIFSGCIRQQKINISNISIPTTTRIPITRKTTTTIQTPPEIDISQLEQDIHELITQKREEQGLSFMNWDDEITEVARYHSEDMANNDYLDHINLEGEDAGDRLEKNGVYYYSSYGENIALSDLIESKLIDEEGNLVQINFKNQTELARDVVDSWMDSHGHRENILTKKFDMTGIGVARSLNKTKYYVTQVFIKWTECGYKTGPCCEKEGYLSSCYFPYKCVSGLCE